jgi:FkbM family methyltransferase
MRSSIRVEDAFVPLPAGYRLERGLLWPADDRACAAVVFDTAPDLEPALAACKGRDVVVQAGGNCGVWPIWLASRFKTVYTFEPDPLNFTCLAWNTAAHPNMIRMQAALGDGTPPHFIDLAREEHNCGAHCVDESRGVLPVMTIDELILPKCDLIVLDIEGYELRALNGAFETIADHKPVIVIEDKGLSEKYGVLQYDAEKWLAAAFGYRVIARPHRDVVLAV